MSMIGCFRSASDAELQALIESPRRIYKVLQPELSGAPSKPSWWQRLLGVRHTPPPDDGWLPEDGNEDFDVDKAWHGIHFALCGDPWAGSGPLAFICNGGIEIGSDDVGYGPARVFFSRDVEAIVGALAALDLEALRQGCRREDFHKNDIYPNIWDEDEEECFGYVFSYLDELKVFLERVKHAGKGLIVYIG